MIKAQSSFTYEQLKTLYEATQNLLLPLNEKEVVKQISESAIRLIGAEAGFIEFLSDCKGCMHIAWPTTRWVYIKGDGAKVVYTLLREVIDTGCSLRILNSNDEERFNSQEWFEQVTHGETIDISLVAEAIEVDLSEARTMLIVPLITSYNDLVGSLYVDRKFNKGTFSSSEQYLLDAFATQAANAIHNAEWYEQEKRSLIDFIHLLVPELRTPLTVILGLTEIMLAESENLTEKQKNDLEVIAEHTKEVFETVDQIIQTIRARWF